MTQSTKDIVMGSSFKGLFVGVNGSGKTIGAASIHLIPGMGRVWVGDFDGRLDPVKRKYPNADIHYDVYGSRNYGFFRAFMDKQCDGKRDYDAYLIDSLTSLTMSNVMWQLRLKQQINDNDKIKTSKAGIPITSFEEINVETILVNELLEQIKYLYDDGASVILTAHPVAKTFIPGGKEGGTVNRYESYAAYGNKVPNIVPNFFNEIYFFQEEKNLSTGQNKFLMRTSKDSENNLAKTALTLPKEIDWTNQDLFPILAKHIEKSTGVSLAPGGGKEKVVL